MNKSSGKEFTRQSFRLSSLGKALAIIEKLKKRIVSIEDLKGIKGIGKGTLSRIQEILDKGKLSEIKLRNEDEQYISRIDDLVKIFGIGKRKANELVMKHGVKNIKDLRKLVKEGKIELPDNIIKGLKYVDKTKGNIPREEIDNIFVHLIETALSFDSKLNVIVCGSYRRQKPTSGDIDVILHHDDIKTKKEAEKSDVMQKFMKLLVKSKFIIDNYTAYDVPTKFMGLCKFKKDIRRIDVRMIPLESIHAATLYFTGSGNFNKKMRRVALELGYTLNEYGLFKGDKKIKVNSEKDIFDELGMEYLPPKLRL